MQALGFIETKGFVAAVEAADSALKAANVSLMTQMRAGSGLVLVVLTGDVAAVKAAVDAGAGSAAAIGQVVAAQVIASPHTDMEAFFGDSAQAVPVTEKSAPKRPAPKASPAAGDQKKSPGV
ncbi:BMC domain-containing protein [bacterium]|nr:BMC domain-containing protein [bacterium]